MQNVDTDRALFFPAHPDERWVVVTNKRHGNRRVDSLPGNQNQQIVSGRSDTSGLEAVSITDGSTLGRRRIIDQAGYNYSSAMPVSGISAGPVTAGAMQNQGFGKNVSNRREVDLREKKINPVENQLLEMNNSFPCDLQAAYGIARRLNKLIDDLNRVGGMDTLPQFSRTSIDEVKSKLYDTLFKEVFSLYNDYGGNYYLESRAWHPGLYEALERYKERFCINYEFLFVLRDNEVLKNWLFITCLAWKNSISEFSLTGAELYGTGLDDLLAFKKVCPDISDFHTLDQLNCKLGTLIEPSRNPEIHDEIRGKMTELVNWYDTLNGYQLVTNNAQPGNIDNRYVPCIPQAGYQGPPPPFAAISGIDGGEMIPVMNSAWPVSFPAFVPAGQNLHPGGILYDPVAGHLNASLPSDVLGGLECVEYASSMRGGVVQAYSTRTQNWEFERINNLDEFLIFVYSNSTIYQQGLRVIAEWLNSFRQDTDFNIEPALSGYLLQGQNNPFDELFNDILRGVLSIKNKESGLVDSLYLFQDRIRAVQNEQEKLVSGYKVLADSASYLPDFIENTIRSRHLLAAPQ